MSYINQRNDSRIVPQIVFLMLVVVLGGVLLSCAGSAVERPALTEQPAGIQNEVVPVPILTATSETSEPLAIATQLMPTATPAAETTPTPTSTPTQTATPEATPTPTPTEVAVEPFIAPEIVDPYQAFQEMGYNVNEAYVYVYEYAEGISFPIYIGNEGVPFSAEALPILQEYIANQWFQSCYFRFRLMGYQGSLGDYEQLVRENKGRVNSFYLNSSEPRSRSFDEAMVDPRAGVLVRVVGVNPSGPVDIRDVLPLNTAPQAFVPYYADVRLNAQGQPVISTNYGWEYEDKMVAEGYYQRDPARRATWASSITRGITYWGYLSAQLIRSGGGIMGQQEPQELINLIRDYSIMARAARLGIQVPDILAAQYEPGYRDWLNELEDDERQQLAKELDNERIRLERLIYEQHYKTTDFSDEVRIGN